MDGSALDPLQLVCLAIRNWGIFAPLRLMPTTPDVAQQCARKRVQPSLPWKFVQPCSVLASKQFLGGQIVWN